MIRAPLFAALTCLALLAQSGTAWAWSNAGGGSHGGANWKPAANAQISGTHTNIGTFTIPGGRTVYVQRYNGNYGYVKIYAETITIAGTLNATGRGYGGGGGGGGGASTSGPYPAKYCNVNNSCFPTSGGPAGGGYGGGGNGAAGYKNCNSSGTSVSGAGGKGGGTYAGGGAGRVVRTGSSGVAHGKSGAKGGYRQAQKNGDGSTNETVWRGSGGGGGSGGAHAFENNHSSIGGSGGGGAGGGGGGAVSLFSDGSINITGAVLTKGANGGGNGNAGDNGYRGRYKCDLQGSGGRGGSAGVESSGTGASGVKGYFVGSSYNSCINRPCNRAANSYGRYGGNGGAGGAGGGGGLLIKGSDISITGTVDSRGGDNNKTNGGTLKVVYCDLNFTSSKTLNGRYYAKESTECNIDIGLRVYDSRKSSKVRRIAGEKDPTKSPVRIYRKGSANLAAGTYGVALVDTTDAKATNVRVTYLEGKKYVTKAFKDLD